MLRFAFLALWFPLMAHSQKFTSADVQRLRIFSTGSFANATQVKSGKEIPAAAILLQPIWQKRKDGAWIFVQLRDTCIKYGIWHYYIQDDTTLVLQFFDFKDREKAVQMSKELKSQSALNIYNLITRRGCEVYLKKDKLQYSGNSTGKDCFSENKNIEYYSYKVSVGKSAIDWWEAAYGKEDNQLFATQGGGYHFIKQIKSSK